MSDASAALAVLTGLAIRLMIPILVTAGLVFVLSRLDRQWQSEAVARSPKVEKPQCWKAMHCSTARRQDCPGYKSAAPCWQAFRQANGYLNQKCLGCAVLANAPAPVRV